MIPLYIPSCDRAAQLHLLIDSIHKNAPNLFDIYINYLATNDEFDRGYQKLIQADLGEFCRFQRRNHYGYDLLNFIRSQSGGIFAHIVDDMIFFKPTVCSQEDISTIMQDKSVFCFNFRVGLNVTVTDYVLQRKVQIPPHEIVFNKYIKWNYREVPGTMWDSYWAFEAPLDGFVARADDILWICENENISEWWYPAHYEKAFCYNGKRNQHDRHYMISPLQSEVFSNQLNVVHGLGFRTNKRFNMTANEINQRYLQGWKFDLSSMDCSNINCAHDEVPVKLIKE